LLGVPVRGRSDAGSGAARRNSCATLVTQPCAARAEYRRVAAERGQAAIELLVAVVLLAVATAAGWQVARVGHAGATAANAARVAARAATVGSDPVVAARSALPRRLRRTLRVRVRQGRVELRVTVPVLGGIGRVAVSGRAAMYGALR
jgi:hypothetical protein